MAENERSQSDVTAEMSELRNRVLAQTKELTVLRWEITSLLRSQPMLAHVTHAKQFLRERFPEQLRGAQRLKRVAKNFVQRLTQLRARERAVGHEIELAPNLCLRPPILLADDGPIAHQIAAIAPDGNLVRVVPGAGFPNSLPLATEGEPPLRGPAPDSLVEWMVRNEEGLRRIGTVVVDAADELSLGLLKGRFAAGQSLLLGGSGDAASPMVAHLGKPIHSDGYSYYASLPNSWLDPLDQNRRPISAMVGGRAWPKISVVMVSFNQAAFLEEGIRSVLDQNYPNLEFLVVDGQSRDGSIEILERYHDRLDFLLIEPDRGQSDGLNKGFAHATGEILTWVNSDDLLEPGALFRVAQAFTDTKVDMVVGGCRQIGVTRSEIINNHHTKLPFGIPIALPLGLLLELDRFWLAACFFYQPEVFFSADIWKRSGGKLRVDLNYVLDYDLWVRMAAAGATILHIPDFLACSRTHEQQKTTVGMPYLPEVQRLLREYSNRLAVPPP